MTTQIVYLDDSEIALEAVKDGLEPFGFDVTPHRNPLTIYAALAASKPALLLLDANMPTLDGKTICALVKRHMRQLPIVIFSGLAASELEALVVQSGADGYIVKGHDYDRIGQDLTAVLARLGSGGRNPNTP